MALVTEQDFWSVRNRPHLYFEKCPPLFSHSVPRLEEVCREGFQKTMLNMVTNISRDWYWYLCREFGIKALNISFGFLSQNNFSTVGCHNLNVTRYPEKPLLKIPTSHILRFNYGFFRNNPRTAFFRTIPHEVCHAITEQLYFEEKQQLCGHEIEWKEVMEFIGMEPAPSFSLLPSESRKYKEYAELPSSQFVLEDITEVDVK